MIGALILIGLLIAVLVLASRLHEARFQLTQAQRERDAYARHTLEILMLAASRLAEQQDKGANQ